MSCSPWPKKLAIVILALTSLAAAACADAPLEIQTIQVGRSINPDRSVATPTTAFKPHDTIYVSILTTDTGSSTIGVRWVYGTKVIDEPSKKVSYQGASATEFHIQSAGGFPRGDYTVEVLIDGKPAGKRTFKVDDQVPP
jgi:hypothetical protein